MSVDLLERNASGEHQDLYMVEKLGNLLRRAVVILVLGGHPHLGRLLDNLFPYGVNSGIELGHGPRALGTGRDAMGKVGEERIKRRHPLRVPLVAVCLGC